MVFRQLYPGSGRLPRKGATNIAELAFVAPVFFLIVIGMIEVGRGFMTVHLLTNAARTGCRVGIIQGKGNTDVTTAISSLMSSHGFNGYTTTVQVNGATGDVANAQAGDQITVKVSVPTSQVTWMPGARFLTGTIAGQYSLRRE